MIDAQTIGWLIGTVMAQCTMPIRFASHKVLQDKGPGKHPKKNGEGGIRTRGKVLPLRRFSKAVLSTTQPPLQ